MTTVLQKRGRMGRLLSVAIGNGREINPRRTGDRSPVFLMVGRYPPFSMSGVVEQNPPGPPGGGADMRPHVSRRGGKSSLALREQLALLVLVPVQV